MIRALCSILVILAVASLQQSTPLSPCPYVFSYETLGTEPGRWYGVVYLSTDSILHSLWLNIVLDSKADILSNWIGDVTTTDNINFKIESQNTKILPGLATPVRFFVQYNPLNKLPRLEQIRLNGREICNAKISLPAIDKPDTITTRLRPRPDTDSRPEVRPEDRPQTRPVSGNPSSDGPVYVPIPVPGYANPFSIQIIRVKEQGPKSGEVKWSASDLTRTNNNDGYVQSQNVGSQTGSRQDSIYRLTTAPPRATTSRKHDEDVGKDEYFEGGQPTFTISNNNNQQSGSNLYNTQNNNNNKRQSECGIVIRNNPNPLVVNDKPTLEGQWPWQIALYQFQTVDSKYICGGTLVSHRHIITAAHCVTRKGSNRVVNKNTLTVYLGKYNLRTSVEGVQIRLIGEIKVHHQYNASAVSRDLAILVLREPVTYTEWVRPACLWPENEVDLSYVINEKGTVVGWGFDDTGVATEELSLVVDQETCIRSYSEFFAKFTSEYTFCAGYRDGTSVCNGDSGGGMVFKKRDRWYLRGLVSLSVARHNEFRCDPSHYVIFTDIAKYLPWVKQYVVD